MNSKKISNSVFSLLFVLLFTAFIFYPIINAESKAAPVANCSLTYIVGCDIWYCWYGNFNYQNCSPCGNNPICF